jgi:hypothetical protein
MNCTLCGNPLDPVLEKSGTHPTCFPFAELDEGDPFTTMIKTKLIDVIKWADSRSPRSLQETIGPSEIGTPCDRRIGYRIAQVPEINTEHDNWPAIVGTSVHNWMEGAMQAWMTTHNSTAWTTEQTLHIDDFVTGHSDLYSHEHEAVIDYKTAGPDVMRKVRKEGPSEGYQIQTHVYGYGFQRLGLPVKKVCLVYLPRAGWMRDMYVWCDDYRPEIAIGSMNRVYQIAQQVVELGISKHPHRWEQVEATPSNECGWCPWYGRGRDAERGADATGCPGR